MTVTTISVDDFLRTNDTVLLPSAVNDRIDERKAAIREAQQDGLEPVEEDVAEANQLIDFRDEVQRITDDHFDSATIVPDDLFADHIREWAEEAYAVAPDIGIYVDWTRFAAGQYERFQQADFGNDVVWVQL